MTEIQRSNQADAQGERDLLARIRAGDVASFESLFKLYHAPLCAYVEGYLGSAESAKEVVSDTFFWLWTRRARLNVTTTLKSYLYGAARNGALNRLRHDRTVRRTHDAAALGGFVLAMGAAPAMPDQEMEARELATLVERTLTELPERAAEAFLLWREHDLSYAEVGHVMGISPRTVEKHLARAVGALREAVAAYRRG